MWVRGPFAFLLTGLPTIIDSITIPLYPPNFAGLMSAQPQESQEKGENFFMDPEGAKEPAAEDAPLLAAAVGGGSKNRSRSQQRHRARGSASATPGSANGGGGGSVRSKGKMHKDRDSRDAMDTSTGARSGPPSGKKGDPVHTPASPGATAAESDEEEDADKSTSEDEVLDTELM